MIELPAGRISGRALRALVTAVRHTPARYVVARVLRQQLGIDGVRALGDGVRGELPQTTAPLRGRASHDRPSAELATSVKRGPPNTTLGYAQAFREHRAEPEEVARRALAAARALAARTPSLGPLLEYDDERALAAARESAARLRRGDARGPLEGVPIAIKEEVDVAGLPTRLGTSWLPSTPAAMDSLAVARLRAQGAVVIGTTPMTEYGLSPLGGNVNRVMPRNAHDPSRLPGGSSSGSGVAVATGVVPVALGADGGGSIRIPACLNGVFGLKPTFGRIPTVGMGLRGGSSVVHLGPLGASTHDLAVFVEAAAGQDGGDVASTFQPALEAGLLVRALGRGVKGLRIGVDEDEWNAARADVARPARAALAALEKEGVTLVPVRIPLARHAAAIGYLTISLEMMAALAPVRRAHMDELGPDLQMLLSNLEAFRPDDYLDGQRLRAQLRREVADVLGDVDLLALPTTVTAAPQVTDAEATDGFVDPPALDAMCRFSFLANLTGIPAATAPVGVDLDGMPIGLQILGDAWDEAAVLQVLAQLERIGVAQVLRPKAHVDLLA
jgi:Asp-tRNA(Asn)/Glu-tRNA(Gln) amidotransferase A subunit family amidase